MSSEEGRPVILALLSYETAFCISSLPYPPTLRTSSSLQHLSCRARCNNACPFSLSPLGDFNVSRRARVVLISSLSFRRVFISSILLDAAILTCWAVLSLFPFLSISLFLSLDQAWLHCRSPSRTATRRGGTSRFHSSRGCAKRRLSRPFSATGLSIRRRVVGGTRLILDVIRTTPQHPCNT